MKFSQILAGLFVCLPLALVHADDITADNLTIQQSATFQSDAYFGTVLSGLQSLPSLAHGFSVSVAQGTSEVNIPYTVQGHYEDEWYTVEEYGWVTSGYWQAQYTWGVVGTQWVPAVYDAEGNVITEGYNEDVYGEVYTGDQWVDTSGYGVSGTHQEFGPVWKEPYQSTYVDYQYGVPKVQFRATRSDTNFAWQVPTESGGVKDILVVWNGGLRVPSEDVNGLMALMSDSLTQSYVQPWDGTTEVQDSSELRNNRLKTVKRVRSGTGVDEVIQESTSDLKAESLNVKQEYQQNGTATAVQTQIGAASASFGGVVQVQGNMAVRGVLRVLPAGDLEMGSFNEGPQP